MTDKQIVMVDVEEYEEMMNEIRFLDCLRHAGVDNWDGYDFALEKYQGGGYE